MSKFDLLSVPDDDRRKLLQKLLGGDVSNNATTLERLAAFRELSSSDSLPTMAALLPLLLNLNNKPYTLSEHFPFETFYQTTQPRNILFKTARQVAKSTNLAAKVILLCNAIPDFSFLFVTPQYEQIQRFSTQYVRPFIENSPVRSLWTGTETVNNVLLRTFKNRSRMYFSFCLLSCDRLRGIPAGGGNGIDEIQDLDKSFLGVIRETMSGPSKWRLFIGTGTPKTAENTIQGLWSNSSQAEWCIVCPSCGKLNIPSLGHDLERMIGPDHPNIGRERSGVICASSKCGVPIDPRQGRWVHGKPDRRWSFPGYHIPQIIMPMHYADRERWAELLNKQRGYGNTTPSQFYNEVLGESYDVGTKLVNETDLRRASTLPWQNDPKSPHEALARLHTYDLIVLAVDWGGGGEEEISFTTMAVLAWRPDGKIDVIYGRKLLTPHDHLGEARQVLEMFRQFNCHLMCHDYTGAGTLRETLIVQAGVPMERIVPISYVAAARQNIMVFRPESEHHPRSYYQVDKTRSLVLTCACIKMGVLRFFQYDKESDDNPGLIAEFLALVENKIATRAGSDLYTITRSALLTDDFAQAVNIGCCTVWHRTQSWPNLAELAALQITVEQMRHISPDNPWDDLNHGMGVMP